MDTQNVNKLSQFYDELLPLRKIPLYLIVFFSFFFTFWKSKKHEKRQKFLNRVYLSLQFLSKSIDQPLGVLDWAFIFSARTSNNIAETKCKYCQEATLLNCNWGKHHQPRHHIEWTWQFPFKHACQIPLLDAWDFLRFAFYFSIFFLSIKDQ